MKNNNKKRNLIIEAIVIGVLILAFALVVIIDIVSNQATVEFDSASAQKIIDTTFEKIPEPLSKIAVSQIEQSDIKVTDIKKGNAKETVVTVSYKSKDILSVYKEHKNEIFSNTYNYYNSLKESGKMANGTKIRLFMEDEIKALMDNAPVCSGKTELYIYEIDEQSIAKDAFVIPYQGAYIRVYLSDELVNTLFGGIVEVCRDAKDTESFVKDGNTVSITTQKTLRNGLSSCFSLRNYDSSKPDTSSFFVSKWNSFCDEFSRNFINNNQWKYLTNGLLTTLEITLLAAIFGIVLGFLCAIVRVTHAKTGKLMIVDQIVSLYLTIIRGTPVMIQLMIIYFVLLLPIGIEKFPAAVICFTINSGAYVAEIVRGGIMSVDNGQMEAGRSLGLNYIQTMYYIIVPQAFKAVLPSLANEFITLLKESSVAFYIGVADLTQGGLKIRSITYSNFMPLVAVAVIYFIIVMVLTKLVGILERRLQKDER